MTVQDLFDEINRAVWANDKAREHAIEAIRTLQEIASEERFTIRDARELIEAWFELVEAK